MNRHIVATTRYGVEVYINLISSPAASKISRQPHLLTLAKEILRGVKLKDEILSVEKDLGRIIGTTDVVKTSDADTILYAKRPKCDVFTRFVKNRKLVPTSYLSIELRQADQGAYQIWDLKFGHKIPAVPGDQNENTQSKSFWSNHAVVWENGLTQAQTITKNCPWPS